MTQREFLQKLEVELKRMNIPRYEEILQDYQEHFQQGAKNKRSEEEIVRKLGDPITLARAFEAERVLRPQTHEPKVSSIRIWGASLRLLLLTPFNFFMLIGPFLVTSVLVFTGWIVEIVFVFVAFLLVLLSLIVTPGFLLNFWATGTFVFGSLSLFFLSLVGLFVMWTFSRILATAFGHYLRWNLDFILDKK